MSSTPQLRAHDHHIDLSTQHARIPGKRLDVLVPRAPQMRGVEGLGLELMLRDGGKRAIELVEESAPDDPHQHRLLKAELPDDTPLEEMHLHAPMATRPSLVAPAGSISELGPRAQKAPLWSVVSHFTQAGIPFVLVHGKQARRREHDIRIPFGAHLDSRDAHLLLVQRYVPENSGGHSDTTDYTGQDREPFVNEHCMALRAKLGKEKMWPNHPGDRFLRLAVDAIRPGKAITLDDVRFRHPADVSGTLNFIPEHSRSEHVLFDGIDLWLNANPRDWEVRGVTVNRPTVICTKGAVDEHFGDRDDRSQSNIRFYDFLRRAKELGPSHGFHVIE